MISASSSRCQGAEVRRVKRTRSGETPFHSNQKMGVGPSAGRDGRGQTVAEAACRVGMAMDEMAKLKTLMEANLDSAER